MSREKTEKEVMRIWWSDKCLSCNSDVVPSEAPDSHRKLPQRTRINASDAALSLQSRLLVLKKHLDHIIPDPCNYYCTGHIMIDVDCQSRRCLRVYWRLRQILCTRASI